MEHAKRGFRRKEKKRDEKRRSEWDEEEEHREKRARLLPLAGRKSVSHDVRGHA